MLTARKLVQKELMETESSLRGFGPEVFSASALVTRCSRPLGDQRGGQERTEK